MLEEIILQLSKKDNLVIVGSAAMKLQGIDVDPKDIDIVVTDLEGLDNYFEYITDSKFSFSGKRAYIFGEINIDIFIENELPEYEIINNIKVETICFMKKYYRTVFPKVNIIWQEKIKSKLELLK